MTDRRDHRLSQDEIDSIRQMFNDGVAMLEIAIQLKTTKNTVLAHVKRMGLKRERLYAGQATVPRKSAQLTHVEVVITLYVEAKAELDLASRSDAVYAEVRREADLRLRDAEAVMRKVGGPVSCAGSLWRLDGCGELMRFPLKRATVQKKALRGRPSDA